MTAWECLIAKTDPQNPEKDLPLWMHLRDTAEVMRYLVQEWLPAGVRRAVKLPRKVFLQTAVFLGAVHDIGKATAAFQSQVLGRVAGMELEFARAGWDPQTITQPDAAERAFAHHTCTGAAILHEREIPEELCANLLSRMANRKNAFIKAFFYFLYFKSLAHDTILTQNIFYVLFKSLYRYLLFLLF